MSSTRCTVFVFKILELVLSIITTVAVIFIEIVSSSIGNLSCFVIVGICGMVCFLSLAFMCTYCQREVLSRPAVLLAASTGAFLFFALALYHGIKQFTSNATTLISFAVFVLCLAMAVVLYIDALITYCGGPHDREREKSNKTEERPKTPKMKAQPKTSRNKRAKKSDEDHAVHTEENERTETLKNRF